ncbi:sigma factor-like helix-turn-helix DNA-binding protein [Fibrisoma limi]|nr:sigma factor-like helix-turn-helix DNA-binding protein [Fibrisoma limi]
MELQDIVISYQPKLFALAYRMTGEVAVSEDIVQESLTNWVILPHEDVQNPLAYLAKTVINRSLNHLAAVKRQREVYKGTWLPEPVVSQDYRRIDAQIDVSYGFMLLLEKLTPTERAVFLLKESFDVEYAELAELLELTEPNSRQLYHRAKEKLAGAKKRFPINSEQQQALQQAFLMASQTGDINPFVRLLKEDIVVYSDGGGKAKAALNPVVGIHHVTAFLNGLARKSWIIRDWQFVEVNGGVGALLFDKETGALDSILIIDLDGDQISNVYIIRNPDKLPTSY